jgi:hypothetical protein
MKTLTITCKDWRNKEAEYNHEEYQAKWEHGTINDLRQLAMWNADEDAVIELEKMQAALDDLRYYLVSKDFMKTYKKQNPDDDFFSRDTLDLLNKLAEEF